MGSALSLLCSPTHSPRSTPCVESSDTLKLEQAVVAARITRRVRTDSVMTLDLMASCCYGSLVGYLNSTGNPPDDTHPSLLPRSRSTYQWPGSYQYWLVSSHQNYCLLQIHHAAGLCHMIGQKRIQKVVTWHSFLLITMTTCAGAVMEERRNFQTFCLPPTTHTRIVRLLC